MLLEVNDLEVGYGDEPSLWPAPSMVDEMLSIIGDIRADGVAVLLVEQNVQKSMEIAGSAYVLEHGRILTSGAPGELPAQRHIQRAYLGVH